MITFFKNLFSLNRENTNSDEFGNLETQKQNLEKTLKTLDEIKDELEDFNRKINS